MKILLLLLLCLLFFFSPTRASAHLLGQESFFTVNGIYTQLYPVPSTSLPNFVLPQDSAHKSFLVGEPIVMEIDTTKLPMMSNETLAKTRFQWDFGDGEKFEGLSTSHIYNNMGSYILEIWADDGNGTAPILLQSLLINIIPDPTFQLPKASITVNGKVSKDSLTDPLSFSFLSPLLFDASKSKVPAGIASIQWDFGDMHTSSEKSPHYQYKDDLRIVFPVLRIRDKNGFIADTFVQINNSDYDTQKSSPKNTPQHWGTYLNSYSVGFLVSIIAVGILIFWKRRADTLQK